jgi:hypothetical protein
MTSFYITTIPICGLLGPDYCNYMSKAVNLFFVRSRSYPSGSEVTVVHKVTPTDPVSRVDPTDMPWALNENSISFIWPQEWNSEPNTSRSSAYNPQTYEVYYIRHADDSQQSELLWSDIQEIHWYRNLNNQRLNTDVRITGMFFDRMSVYAIGDRPQAHDTESYIYILRANGNTRELFPLVSDVHIYVSQRQLK